MDVRIETIHVCLESNDNVKHLATKALQESVVTSSCLHNYITRQAVHILCNIEARSRNHCCRGRAIIVTYSVYVRACVHGRA